MSVSHIIGLGGKLENFGLLLVWKCPHCEEERDFNLVGKILELEILHLIPIVDFNRILFARCSKCPFEIGLTPPDIHHIKKIKQTTGRYKNKELQESEYHQALESLGIPLIHDLKVMTETWKCPQCGEENPTTFTQCWNCTEHENKDVSPETTAPQNPPIRGIGGTSNPWE